jgi:ABC-type glycerol-3-phosphate transport system substrate-binding protein
MSTRKSETQQADVSRRRFLKIGAGVVVVAAAGAGGYYYLTQPPSGPPTPTETTSMTEATTSAMLTPEQIEWGIWSWGVELVQDNSRIFNEANPDIHVKVGDYGLDTYGSGIATAYAGGKPPDMHYSTPDITITYQNAKQSYDMETDYPEIKKYNDDIFPGYQSGLVNPYTGKMYGLFYYSGGQTFSYNKRHLIAAGIGDQPPKTMDELRDQAKKIKAKSATDKTLPEFPLGYFAGSWGFTECAVYTTMMTLTDEKPPFLFDEELKPKFNYKGSPLFNALKFIGDTIWTDKTSTTAVTQYDEATTVKVMGSGKHSFIWMPDYELAFINANDSTTGKPVADESFNIKFAVSPGSGRISSIYRTYVPSHTANDSGLRHRDAVWRLMQFTGGKTTNTKPDFANGKYQVVKRLAMQAGLAFPYISMWDDQEILDSMKSWCDPLVRKDALALAYDFFNDPKMTPWWDPWFGYWLGGFVRPKLHSIWLGEHGKPASDDYILQVLNDMAAEWTKMKQAAGG